jgi:hypothetical protein
MIKGSEIPKRRSTYLDGDWSACDRARDQSLAEYSIGSRYPVKYENYLKSLNIMIPFGHFDQDGPPSERCQFFKTRDIGYGLTKGFYGLT